MVKRRTKAYKKYPLDKEILEFVVTEKMQLMNKQELFHVYDFREDTTRDLYFGLLRDTLDKEEKKDFDRNLIYLLHGWTTRIINPISAILKKKIDNGEISRCSWSGKKVRYTKEGNVMGSSMYKFAGFIPYHKQAARELEKYHQYHQEKIVVQWKFPKKDLRCRNHIGKPKSNRCRNKIKTSNHKFCDDCRILRHDHFQAKRHARDIKLANRVKSYYEGILEMELPGLPKFLTRSPTPSQRQNAAHLRILLQLPKSARKDFRRIVMGEEEE